MLNWVHLLNWESAKAIELYEECNDKIIALGLNRTKFGVELVSELIEAYDQKDESLYCGKLSKREYEQRSEYLPLDAPDTLKSLQMWAISLRKQGLYEEASQHFEKCFDRQKSTLSDLHLDTLTTLHYWGILLYEQGDYKEAKVKFRYCVKKKINAKHYHLSIVATMCELARTYHAQQVQRCIEKALPLYRDGFEVRREKLGIKHPLTNKAFNGILCGYLDLNELGKAQSLLEECEPLRDLAETIDSSKLEEVLSSSVIKLLTHLGRLKHEEEKYDEARQYDEKHLRIERKMDPDNNSVAIFSTYLALARLNLDQAESNRRSNLAQKYLQEAKKYCRNCFEWEWEGLAKNQLKWALLEFVWGRYCFETSNFDEAIFNYESCLRKRTSILGENHPETLKCFDKLEEVKGKKKRRKQEGI